MLAPGPELQHRLEGPAQSDASDEGARRHAPFVRDDRPFSGPDPPAALFHYSRDRSGDHPVEHLGGFAGILQADAYAGYNRLYEPGRSPGPVSEALCWSHGRRRFYELADIAANRRRGKRAPPVSPLAMEAVKRIDALFDIEREINGETAERRLAVRRESSAPIFADLGDWMRTARAGLSRHAAVAKAMDYMLKRWDGFARFLKDGRVCLTNNSAERALRPLALGRKSWLFAGSDRGGKEPPQYTRSSAPPSSTMSTRRPGSPMSSAGSPKYRKTVCPISCPGTGKPTGNWIRLLRPRPSTDAYT